ncbi:MAG: hypothetical protein HQK72_03045 [Desulfamplus sp.]|nr:hypothetical protein [Desulfamplus sp.]
MIENVYVHTKVEKEINRLQDQENTPAFAAKKANQIISSLANGTKPALAGKLTKSGDARMKKCLKYDLGKGYRLICVKERKSIYVLYTGSHDSCDTWLDKHRNFKIDAFMEYLSCWCGDSSLNYNALSLNDGNCFSDDSTFNKSDLDCEMEEADYDDILMSKITQKDLRAIFQGFIN